MMISKEQAHAAAEHLRFRGPRVGSLNSTDVSPEVFAAAFAVVQNTPDTNPQRMADGRHYLDTEGADSRVVASMMIHRIISDSIR